jgi:hypothetical protein
MDIMVDDVINQIKLLMYNECSDLIKKISEKYTLNENEVLHTFFPDNEKEIVKKKRGRKKKTQDNFINVHSDIIDGKKVLIDDDNIVYTNIRNPLIIGKMNKEGKIESI